MIEFFLLQFAYAINHYFLKWQWLETVVFNLLKLNIFQIQGQCKKTGACCQAIMIYDNQHPIDSLDRWQAFVKKKPDAICFIPRLAHGKVTAYDCQCLTNKNTCSNYINRPDICKQYPHSFFYTHGYILPNCGFRVTSDSRKSNWLLLPIREKIREFMNHSPL